MDGILEAQSIEALAQAGVGMVALIALIILLVAWVRDRGSKNRIDTQLIALLSSSQINLERLTDQNAQHIKLNEQILAAIERGNDTDEKTSAAIMDNTAAIVQQGTQASQHHTVILDRLEVLEATMQDTLRRLFEQVEQQGASQAAQSDEIKCAIETKWGELLNELKVIRDERIASLAVPEKDETA